MSWLSWMSMRHSRVRFPSSGGIVPVSWLPAKRVNRTRFERLPSSGGISPHQPVAHERFNTSRLERRPNSGGSSPARLLLARCSSVTWPLEFV